MVELRYIWFASIALLLSSAAGAKPSVTVKKADSRSIERDIIYAARIEPLKRVLQTAQFEGKVHRVLVEVGSQVRAGQALAELERQSLGQAFSRFQLTANIGGTINQALVKSGMEFKEREPLFEIIDVSKLLARVSISDKDRPLVQKGGPAAALLPRDVQVEGTITSVAIAADITTGLFPVEIEFNKAAAVFPGQYVRLSVGKTRFDGVIVPRIAIEERFGAPHLFVVDQDSKVALRRLTLGPEFGIEVGVVDGLQTGELYVVEATEELQDGVQVNVEEQKEGGRRRG